MIRRILVPCDGSSAAEHALRSGIELAKATRATVVGLAITEPFPLKMYGELMVAGVGPLQHYNDQERALAEHALAPVEKAARAAGVDYLSASVSNSSAADAIISAAEQESCDLICLAAHDRRNLLGTHLDHDTVWVLAHARVPVLLCH
jgi:nucleotide-binding universal stress UspA family protein